MEISAASSHLYSMDVHTKKDNRPILGRATSRVIHAADPAQITDDHWAPAICRTSLWVQVLRESGIDRETDRVVVTTVAAYPDGSPRISDDGVLTGDVPTCRTCIKMLSKVQHKDGCNGRRKSRWSGVSCDCGADWFCY